jgi:N-methylhydantoinase A
VTVTDADLVLGLLDADKFLGGDMPLDKPAAEAAMDRLASALGTSRDQTAGGIYRIVAETMAGAARAHATDRGVDHRGLPLLAFGGAGPVHACAVGELLQSTAVIFPPQASVLSAFGALVTPVRLDLVRSAVGRLGDLDWDVVDGLLGEMEAEALEALVEAGTTPSQVRWSFGADLRYVGQQNEVGVALDFDPRTTRSTDGIRQVFEAAYLTQYGVNPSHVPIEIVSWRLTAMGPENVFVGGETPFGSGAAPRSERVIPLWSSHGPAKVYDRAALAKGQVLCGPALIEERETTIVLPPGWNAVVAEFGCLTATRKV